MAERPKIRVLVVDDSSVIRTLYTEILNSDDDIEVVGTAIDPYIAREKLVSLQPDVMTLDIEMPRMDGITFLKKVMEHLPTKTIVISSLSKEKSQLALEALSAGAIDVLEKPSIDVKNSIQEVSATLISRVKNVYNSKLILKSSYSALGIKRRPIVSSLNETTHQIIAIASSTGGTEALKEVLPYLPSSTPGIVMVQHMPPVFTKSYADQLNALCDIEVKEAKHGDRVIPGQALLAPGNFHMELYRSGAYYYVKLHQKPAIFGIRPAANYLMDSVAKYAGKNAIGLVLTGMGRDGASGLLNMKKAGSVNYAQNEDTCVVYGMPKEAVNLGAIHHELPLNKIAAAMIKEIEKRELLIAS